MDLYKEVVSKTGIPLTAEESERVGIMLQVTSTKVIKATSKEIAEAKKYYKEHGECKNHLVYDKESWIYYERRCGICDKFIAMV